MISPIFAGEDGQIAIIVFGVGAINHH